MDQLSRVDSLVASRSSSPELVLGEAEAAPSSGANTTVNQLVMRSHPFNEPVHLELRDNEHLAWTRSGYWAQVNPDGSDLLPRDKNSHSATHGQPLAQVLTTPARNLFLTETGRIYGTKYVGFLHPTPLYRHDITGAKSGVRLGTACVGPERGLFYATQSNKVVFLGGRGRLVFKQEVPVDGQITRTACLASGLLVAGTSKGRLVWLDSRGHCLGKRKIAHHRDGPREIMKLEPLSETTVAVGFSNRVIIVHLFLSADYSRQAAGSLLGKSSSGDRVLLHHQSTAVDKGHLCIWRPDADQITVLNESIGDGPFVACFGPSDTVIGGEVGRPLKIWAAKTGTCLHQLADAHPSEKMQFNENLLVCDGGDNAVTKV